MSKPQATPEAQLVMPWEKTAEERDSVETAESSLFDLLGSDPEFATPEKDKKRPPVSEREDEDPNDEDGPLPDENDEDQDSLADEGDEDDDFEEEDDDLEYEDDEDEADGDEYEDDGLHVVKVDGEEIEVEYEELVAGYSRTEYLTRTRQKEADEYRQAMQGVQTAQSEYAEKLELMTQALDQLSPTTEPDWEKVQRENPAEFGAIFAAHQKREKVRKAVAAEKKAEAEMLADTQAEKQSAYVSEQFEMLTNAIPVWKKDQKAMAEEIGEISNFAVNHLGFTEGEMATVNDHRVILALRAAKRGFEMETGGKKLLRKKKKRTRTLRPSGEKRGKTQKTGKRRRLSAKRNQKRGAKVARTGRVQDAASLFEGMLEDGADL